jgi:hypothetical protein
MRRVSLSFAAPALALPRRISNEPSSTFHPHVSKKSLQLDSAELNKLTFTPSKPAEEWDNPIQHPVWNLVDADKIVVNHKPVGGIVDAIAYGAVKVCRWGFDTFSLFRFGKLTEKKVIMRCLFLETVAGVPGMVGGMVRHLHSLRGMKRDHGWIHTLLEEAENERMHLLTFMTIHRPGIVFRASIIVAQGLVFNFLMLMYLICPRFVHRFVGYLEEEAVRTYSHIIEAIDEGKLPEFRDKKAPKIATTYWHLGENATYRDMFNVIRADEAGHRLVNHTFADMHATHHQHDTNPFLNRLHGSGDNDA